MNELHILLFTFFHYISEDNFCFFTYKNYNLTLHLYIYFITIWAFFSCNFKKSYRERILDTTLRTDNTFFIIFNREKEKNILYKHKNSYPNKYKVYIFLNMSFHNPLILKLRCISEIFRIWKYFVPIKKCASIAPIVTKEIFGFFYF